MLNSLIKKQSMSFNVPTKKKIPFQIRAPFWQYLNRYNRQIELPIYYEDLLRYVSSIPLYKDGEDTLWDTVFYTEADTDELYKALTKTYALLKADGDEEMLEHLAVARIDFCHFGNTQPFRVRIINQINDNYDHFYVKRADASRLYGLELEHVMSPSDISYLVNDDTLIEEHIAGIPGYEFMEHNLEDTTFNQIRIAKEFVKFNERCFVRLLGDMRAYNYVVDITPDIEGKQFRFRAIDFDQQSYEGWKSFYLPQYFKENNPIIFLGIQHISMETMRQYQLEERTLMAMRIKMNRTRVNDLLNIMVEDTISSPDKVEQLRNELSVHHKNNVFLQCRTMGEIVTTHIRLLVQKDFKQSMSVWDKIPEV